MLEEIEGYRYFKRIKWNLKKNCGFYPDILLVWFVVWLWLDVRFAPVSLNVVMSVKLANELLLVNFVSSAADPTSVLFPVVLPVELLWASTPVPPERTTIKAIPIKNTNA